MSTLYSPGSVSSFSSEVTWNDVAEQNIKPVSFMLIPNIYWEAGLAVGGFDMTALIIAAFKQQAHNFI